MMNLSYLQIEQVPHSELVMMVRSLLARVESLEKEVQMLCEENERLKSSNPNLQNSSQPPSRDQKSNSSNDQSKKKHGPPAGYNHMRLVRQLVENQDKLIFVDVDQCASCHHDLTGTKPSKVVQRQVTELPETKPIVPVTQQTEKTSLYCQHLNRAELPAELEADRFFCSRFEATIVFLKHQNHFSYARIVNALRELFGLEISEVSISAIIARTGSLMSAEAAEIRKVVKSSAVIQSDETSARVNGRNYWHWVFLSEIPKLIPEAIHMKNRTIGPSADLTLNGFHRRVSDIGNRLDRLLGDQLTDSDEIRLQNRFRRHRKKLLTFLDYPGDPPTNSASEQDIRTYVIHRKVNNGFRSEWSVTDALYDLDFKDQG